MENMVHFTVKYHSGFSCDNCIKTASGIEMIVNAAAVNHRRKLKKEK